MSARSLGGTTALLGMFLLLSSLAWLGCDDAQTPLEPASRDVAQSYAADPVEDALLGSDGRSAPESDRRMSRLAEILELDAMQLSALGDAYYSFRTAMQALRAEVRDGRLATMRAREEAGLLKSGFEAQLQVILTEAQYDHLQQLRQLCYQQHHAHRDAVRRWADWGKEIGASQEQFDLILVGLETLRHEITDLRAQLRDGHLSRDEAYRAAQDFRSAFDATLSEILSAEQYEALMGLRPDGGRRP